MQCVEAAVDLDGVQLGRFSFYPSSLGKLPRLFIVQICGRFARHAQIGKLFRRAEGSCLPNWQSLSSVRESREFRLRQPWP